VAVEKVLKGNVFLAGSTACGRFFFSYG